MDKKGLTISDMLKNPTKDLVLDKKLLPSKHCENFVLNGDIGKSSVHANGTIAPNPEVIQRHYLYNEKRMYQNIQSNYSIINRCNNSDIGLVVSGTTSKAVLASQVEKMATKNGYQNHFLKNKNAFSSKTQRLCSESPPSSINKCNVSS